MLADEKHGAGLPRLATKKPEWETNDFAAKHDDSNSDGSARNQKAVGAAGCQQGEVERTEEYQKRHEDSL
eukprot:9320892-Pyramimonas_sp.AAC.1